MLLFLLYFTDFVPTCPPDQLSGSRTRWTNTTNNKARLWARSLASSIHLPSSKYVNLISTSRSVQTTRACYSYSGLLLPAVSSYSCLLQILVVIATVCVQLLVLATDTRGYCYRLCPATRACYGYSWLLLPSVSSYSCLLQILVVISAVCVQLLVLATDTRGYCYRLCPATRACYTYSGLLLPSVSSYLCSCHRYSGLLLPAVSSYSCLLQILGVIAAGCVQLLVLVLQILGVIAAVCVQLLVLATDTRGYCCRLCTATRARATDTRGYCCRLCTATRACYRYSGLLLPAVYSYSCLLQLLGVIAAVCAQTTRSVA
jgi:hypothetical protein